ncbi:MAG TPA: flagellar export chaperone FliS [Kineosporiaceae bacterium]
MSYGLAQARYASDATATVPAGRLLTMLYDRLVQDLSVAESAMRDGDVAATGERLGQAQEILLELHATLDVSVWPDGEALGRIYLWIISELNQARLRGQPQRIADCRELVQPLRDAWHEAARTTAATTCTAPVGIDGAA